MARVSVVIPHLNGVGILGTCLNALQRQSFSDFDVVLVDNGSTDESVSVVKQEFPWVHVLELGENKGFAGGCNAGIRRTESEFIALLNNDTHSDRGWLEALVSALDAHPQAGFAASRILRSKPPHNIDSAGDWYVDQRGVPLNLCAGEPADSCMEPSWVFGASAAASIYRSAMLNEIGLFDEDFFYIMEDVDLDFRAQLAGYRCLYVPNAVVFHDRGVSMRLELPEVRATILRNSIWTAGKNLPATMLLGTLARVLPLGLAWLARRLAQRLRAGRAPERYFDGSLYARYVIRAIVALPRKRMQTQRLRRVSIDYLRKLLTYSRLPLEEE